MSDFQKLTTVGILIKGGLPLRQNQRYAKRPKFGKKFHKKEATGTSTQSPRVNYF